MRSTPRWVRTAALALLSLAAAVLPAHAAVYTVTRTLDSADGPCVDDCSLREAVLAANAHSGADVILLGPGTYNLTLAGAGEDSGATGDLDLRDDVTIVGSGAGSTIVDGGGHDRVFDVSAGVHAEIRGVTIRNGLVAGNGGGVRNAGVLSVTRSVVTGNTAGQGGNGGGLWTGGPGSQLSLAQDTIAGNVAAGVGGGIEAAVYLRLDDSTINGNRAVNGGGLYVVADSDVLVTDSTIDGNTATQEGGGVFAEIAPFISVNNPELRNSILAGNTAASQVDCAGAVRSGGYNLLGAGVDCNDFGPAHHDLVGTPAQPLDARLGPLANNGGPTPTQALLANSPAINAGSGCGPTDQRGQSRPAGSACEIGAFEVGNDCLTGGATLCLNNDRFRVSVQWRTQQGAAGSGQAVPLTGESGYFWFFDPANVELTVKVLNGCGTNHHYWAFLSGLTNVDVTVTVTDTASGATKTYHSPLGTTFTTTLDAAAFATCP